MHLKVECRFEVILGSSETTEQGNSNGTSRRVNGEVEGRVQWLEQAVAVKVAEAQNMARQVLKI
jgi:hypothetical protein